LAEQVLGLRKRVVDELRRVLGAVAAPAGSLVYGRVDRRRREVGRVGFGDPLVAADPERVVKSGVGDRLMENGKGDGDTQRDPKRAP
jgi:hypothetical protein